MIPIPWDPPYPKAQLDERATPSDPSQPEVFPDVLYSTVTFSNADTGPFVFFGTVESDKTLSNQQQQNALPLTQYFIIHYVTCDILRTPSAGTDAAVNPAISEMEDILKGQRAIVQLTINAKTYGPFPLMMAGSSGGTTGFAYAEGATAAGNNVAVVNNGTPGQGGFPYGGALILSPQTNYDAIVTLKTGGLITVAADLPVRLGLVGVRYRQVR